MSENKLVNSTQLDIDLTSVASAIRTKGGTSGSLTFPQGFISAVEAIDIGYTPSQIFVGGSSGVSGDIVVNGSGKEYAFYKCPGIKSVQGNMTACPMNSFNSCTGMTKFFNIGHCWHGANSFGGCTNLKYWIGINAYDFYGGVFNGCTSLLAIDTLQFQTRAASVCQNCSKLSTLIIRSSTVTSTLYNINVFTGTPFADGKAGGTLYVPQALITSYQSATNWSTILGYANNQILPIEGSIYETQYADSTPII